MSSFPAKDHKTAGLLPIQSTKLDRISLLTLHRQGKYASCNAQERHPVGESSGIPARVPDEKKFLKISSTGMAK
jgi:hypothetical protein